MLSLEALIVANGIGVELETTTSVAAAIAVEPDTGPMSPPSTINTLLWLVVAFARPGASSMPPSSPVTYNYTYPPFPPPTIKASIVLLPLLRSSMLILLPPHRRRPDSAPARITCSTRPSNSTPPPDALHVSLGNRSSSVDKLVFIFFAVGTLIHGIPCTGERVFCGVYQHVCGLSSADALLWMSTTLELPLYLPPVSDTVQPSGSSQSASEGLVRVLLCRTASRRRRYRRPRLAPRFIGGRRVSASLVPDGALVASSS